MDRLYILAGFLWLVAGMIFGIYLGITDQLQFANSHAHANLLGFVISVLFGLLYRNWPALLSSRLAWPQFALFQIGALMLVAGKFDIDRGGGGALAPPGSNSRRPGHAGHVLDVRKRWEPRSRYRKEGRLMSPGFRTITAPSDIVGRILAAVPWAATDGASLAAEQLFPFDQLHGRELLATRDHAAKLNPAGAPISSTWGPASAGRRGISRAPSDAA